MSSHYTVDFQIDLRRDLSEIENSVLKYLIQEGNSERPNELPEHAYFQSGLPKYPYWYAYRNFPGPFISSIWERGQDIKGIHWGLCLRLPTLKLEDVYENFILGFAVWLATLSASNGYVGSVWEEDYGELHTLLYVYDGELYMDTNTNHELKSVISGLPPKK